MKFKTSMMQEFEMYYIWILSYILEMEFKDTRKNVSLHQKTYTQDILKMFKMSKCNVGVTPLETEAKLRKETINELVNSTLYK